MNLSISGRLELKLVFRGVHGSIVLQARVRVQ